MNTRYVKIMIGIVIALIGPGSGPVLAQHAVIDAERVRTYMEGGRRIVLIDVRSAEEYRDGHIPGAINIPAERIAEERKKLPKDRTVPLIFYCRGIG